MMKAFSLSLELVPKMFTAYATLNIIIYDKT